MHRLLAGSVPWGMTARSPGNHDGPGYTSDLPYNPDYNPNFASFTDPTPMGVAEQGANVAPYVSDAAEEPIPVMAVGARIEPLAPLQGSGQRGKPG